MLLHVLFATIIFSPLTQSDSITSSYNTCALSRDISFGGKYGDLTIAHGVSITLGNSTGTHVVVNSTGASDSDIYNPVYSASKMVTAMIMMTIVEDQSVDLSLDDHVSKHLLWWTTNGSDPRANVTLRHLLSQSSGFGPHSCSYDPNLTTEQCAHTIYNSSFGVFSDITGTVPISFNGTVKAGSHFFYDESHFLLSMALALAATKASSWNYIFDQYIGTPLNLDESCRWVWPSEQNVDPGAGLKCSPKEYARILHAYFSNELLTESSTNEMESGQISVNNLLSVEPSWYATHYGLGMWRICALEDCTDPPVVHSIGAAGFYPWVDRKLGYWGIVGRNDDISCYGNNTNCSTTTIMLSNGLQRDIGSLYTNDAIPYPCSADILPEKKSSSSIVIAASESGVSASESGVSASESGVRASEVPINYFFAFFYISTFFF